MYVFGVGRIQSGDLYNIVPDRVEILGSYRTFDMDTTDCINRTINDCLDKVLEKYMRPGEEFFGLPTYTLDIQLGYPVLVNDPAFTCAVYSKLQKSFPEQRIYTDIEKIFPSEDFSRYLEKVPGVFIMLGNCSPTEKIVRISHSCTFDIDEKILITGTKIFHIISMDFLKNPMKYLNPQKFGCH
jgi:metal-dependent amidase/aminoacylase/carboxypeptidase family protein